jgi:N-acetylglutamate synthase-like GNAT family acetyltransferase
MSNISSLENFIVSDDKNKLNLNLIHNFLTNSYWAKGITLQVIEEAVKHSICFGVYINNEMVGFARVISDHITFAYLLDVFILENFRKRGLSIELLNNIFSHPDLKNVKKWMLATKDAHNLYRKFGFEVIGDSSRVMVYKRDNY